MTTTASQVMLREITADTVRAVTKLSVAEDQMGFVAPNAVSLAQALFAPEAWYRAIYFGEELAGFVMLEDESLLSPPPAQPEVGVWRFMIDARFQGRGIGRAALLQVIEHVRSKGLFTTLQLSYVPGPGCPEAFYLSLGFRHTGRIDEGEIVLELPLADGAPEDAHPDTWECGMTVDAASLRDQIIGTWRMLSWTRILVGSGEQSDALGPNPFGYISYSPDGRLMVFVLKSGRPKPAASPPTLEEKLALFDTLFSYVGRYTVEADRVVHRIDGSWNELWTGTTQTRILSFQGSHLVYTTPETVDPMDGRLCTYRVEFERA